MLNSTSSSRDFLKNYRSILLFVTLGGIAVILLFYGLVLFHPWNRVHLSEKKDISVQRGMTPLQIARHLKSEGVIVDEKRFLLGAKLLGATRNLQAGMYRFEGSLTNYAVLRNLREGRVLTSLVTFPEGKTAAQIAEIVEETYGMDTGAFLRLVSDTAFCRSLGVQASSLEGYLFPDTYRFHLDPAPEEILSRMVARFQEMFDDTLRDRMEQIHFDLHEVVTLASIIEGEAALASERTTISAVYHNRLRRRMYLQADPTIQYIIEDGPRRLLNRDLEIDSPYNTYLYPGLPPGPVNNPGIACLRAALYPDNVDVLYMVANGNGAHVFSRTMREHLEAKSKFDRIRRQVRRRPSP